MVEVVNQKRVHTKKNSDRFILFGNEEWNNGILETENTETMIEWPSIFN